MNSTPPPSSPPTNTQPTIPRSSDQPNPDPANPPEESSKKPRFARFKKPAFNIPGRKNPNGNSSSAYSLSAQLASAHITPPDPEKEVRRAARRAQRQREEDEWTEKNHQRRKEAFITNRPFVPLDPLPPFNSDSETESERNEPHAASIASPDADTSDRAQLSSLPDMHRETPTEPATTDGQSGVDNEPMRHSVPGPYLPQSPHVYEGAPMVGPHPATPDGAHIAMQEGITPTIEQPPHQYNMVHNLQQHPGRDTAAEAQMAEMFGRQAYMGNSGVPSADGVSDSTPSIQQFPQPQQHQQQGQPSVSLMPRPVGWGDAYGSVPSMPMYGDPSISTSQVSLVVDHVLMEKIRRGRELARLAVAQEEQSNLGAAEAGYMKALALLVPAAKELDIGGELNKTARMHMKQKVQREAAAMLDRVEELKMFLKANGPAVPIEVPIVPKKFPSSPRAGKRTGRDIGEKSGSRKETKNVQGDEGQKRASVARELKEQRSTGHQKSSSETVSTMVRPTAKSQPPKSREPTRPPPPPPPSFDADSGDLFKRISNRKNIVVSASHVFQPAGTAALASNPSLKLPRAGKAACFMCNASAELAAPCDHTFCAKCGDQAVSVFGKCPVPKCGEPLAQETFAQLQ